VTPLEPIDLGPRSARSRIVFGPHETNLADGRAFSARHIAYYERRAAAGVGVIVTEEASVHHSDWPYERCPAAWECGPGWTAIVEACRPQGALVIAALGHAGGQGSSAYSQAPLWAPSRVPEVNSREVPKWMEPTDVAAVVDGFGAAAGLAVGAGCDGVEINAGQFSLVRQFLSGLTNQRGDEWADRTKFARDVLVAVRSAIGADAVVGLRLSCDELAPWAGLVPDAAAELAAELAAHVDYLTVVRGSIYSTAATRPDGHVAPGFNLDLVAQVRTAVRAVHGDRVAVIAQGSIVDWSMAEGAIAEGRADAVEMTRALIADARLVTKASAGHPERIRPCVLCNQTCQVRDARNPIVTCVVDPRSGHETEDVPLDTPARTPSIDRPVVVIGGGVAGLEAARVAARRGHRVVLFEAANQVGGMVRAASRGAGRERLAAIIDWLAAECDRLGVEVHTNDVRGFEAGAMEWAAKCAAVIVATGGQASRPSFTTTRAAVVVTAADVLAHDDPAASLPTGPIMLWDPIGGPIAVSVAELLAGVGRDVTLVTPDGVVGNELSRSGDLAPANGRLQQAGVTLERRVVLRAVMKGSVEVEERFSGSRRTIKASVVIDASHRLPNDALFRRLDQDSGVRAPVIRVGDAIAPRTIHEAILDGRRAALAVDGIGHVSDGVAMPAACGGHS